MVADLARTVIHLAQMTHSAPDDALARPWAWKSYRGEGVRYAFFRTYEELSELAVDLAQLRQEQGLPFTSAQLILGGYQAAYRDLQASILGLSAEQMEQEPAPGEWPVHKVIAHVIDAEIGFYTAVKFALDRHRAGAWTPAKLVLEDYTRISGLNEEAYSTLMEAPLAALLEFEDRLHDRILVDFAGVTDDELEKPSVFWEEDHYSLRFRLGRFESHIRQHTIQIDKTTCAVAPPPCEARRLLRLIYAGLAGVEGRLIGAPHLGRDRVNSLAVELEKRSAEIVQILA